MRNKALVVATLVLTIIVIPQLVFADATAPDGAAIYKTKCSSCHGADGKGQTSVGKAMKIADLGGADVQKMTDAEIAKIIESGKGKMPAYKGKLTADEINALVKAIRAFKK